MRWIKLLLKAELDFISQKRTQLLLCLSITFTLAALSFLVIRAIRPNQRNFYSVAQVMWQSSVCQKIQMIKACALLNASNFHVQRGEQKIARIYLEYDTELNFLLFVMASDHNDSVIMSVVDSSGILHNISVYKSYGLTIY